MSTFFLQLKYYDNWYYIFFFNIQRKAGGEIINILKKLPQRALYLHFLALRKR